MLIAFYTTFTEGQPAVGVELRLRLSLAKMFTMKYQKLPQSKKISTDSVRMSVSFLMSAP